MSEPDSTQSQNTDVPAPRRAGPAMPYRWPASDRLWRLSRRLTPDLINTFLKFRSARGIPDPQRARFEAMNLPDETIDRALGEVHKLEDWVGSWSRAAQRFMAESRRNELVGEWDAASVARRNAALCYHVAHLITLDDPRTVRALRASAVQSFLMSIQQMNPETRKIGIPWRTRKLPGYLSIPLDGDDPLPLIVVLNGATTTKEETFVWSQHLNGASYAILNLDWPGTGEAADGTQLSSYCDDMTDGIFELAEAEDRIDPERVALVGVSLGGVVALRAAAMDRRVWAVATVTPPFDPRKWIDVVNPLVASQLVSMAGNSPSVPVLLEDFSLPNVVSRVRCPTLVFGAARDLVVPPDEATRTAGAIGDLATLVWYPDGGHGLYDRVDEWLSITAEWLDALDSQDEDGVDQPGVEVSTGDRQSTRVDTEAEEIDEVSEEVEGIELEELESPGEPDLQDETDSPQAV